MKNLTKKYDIALFDLDGTISQSAAGIRKGIEFALKKVNRSGIDLNDYSKYIGPPLLQTFEKHCGLEGEDIKTAFDAYVHYYNTHGKHDNVLFDGVDTVIKKLRAVGTKVAVCSSKYEKFAQEVVELLNVSQLFDAVCGSTHDGTRKEKEQIIPYAIKTLGGTPNDKVVMIGDTQFDAKGAMLTGVDFVGVTYGYGTKNAMQEFGAVNFAETPIELLDFLLLR